MSFILVGCAGSFISLFSEFPLMVEPYTLFADVVATFAVGVVGWVILLFISRGLAWACSAFFSLLFLLLLVIHDLAALPAASPATRWDMLSATGLCLAVHLVSDYALAILAKRMIRVSVAALTETMEAAGSKDPMPFHAESIRSFGD